MELIRGQRNLKPQHRGCVATIGNFDGLHLGHQAVIAQVTERAREYGLPSCLMTFEPHPREYFDPGNAPARLSRLRDKAAGVARLGIDRLLVLRFDEALTSMEPETFAEQLVAQALGARHVVVGDDFRFGRARRGDFALLAALGERHGFAVEAAQTRKVGDERVSSTRVRQALDEGDLDQASRLLGGPYTLRGRVIHGDKRGRELGYPTANIALDGYRLPTTGVFAVLACDDRGRRFPGVANLGWRPMVASQRPLLEVYAFDFEGDLYGAHLAVELHARLRPEERFDSMDALVEQMHADARDARALLAESPST
ncbi:MAG: bifunctional riboflavin kinase/FAD synthetase [Halofilum sp. (in: g-proteobacteria)]